MEQFFRFFQRIRTTKSDSLLSDLLPVKQKNLPKVGRFLARAAGLEPAISGVTGQRDNQLRYARVMFVILNENAFCVNK